MTMEVPSGAVTPTNAATPGAKPRRPAAALTTTSQPTPANTRRLLSISMAAIVGLLVGGLLMHVRDRRPKPLFFVNGAVISREDFDRRLETVAGAQVAQQMVGEQLKIEFARQNNALPTDQEVDARYAELSKKPNFAQQLAASHQSIEDFKRAILLDLINRKMLTAGVTVSDTDVHNYYAAQANPNNPRAAYYTPETVQLQVVISNSPADIDRARQELAHGAVFADVARKYSKDINTKNNGGLLGPVLRGRIDPRKYPGLEAEIFSMHAGQQIDKFQTGGYWWLIRCVDKTPQRVTPFSQVQDECSENAKLVKGVRANGQRVQAEFEKYKGKANIVLPPQFQVSASK